MDDLAPLFMLSTSNKYHPYRRMTSVPVTPTLAENTVNMFRKDRLERYSLSASDAPLNVVRNDRAGMAGKQFVWILQDVQSKVL